MNSPVPINQRALLTRKDAAAYLSISYTTFLAYEASGDVKGIKIGTGKEKRYRRSDLDTLIDKMEQGETNIDRTKRQ